MTKKGSFSKKYIFLKSFVLDRNDQSLNLKIYQRLSLSNPTQHAFLCIFLVSMSRSHKLFMHMIFLCTRVFLYRPYTIFCTNNILHHQHFHQLHVWHNNHYMTHQLTRNHGWPMATSRALTNQSNLTTNINTNFYMNDTYFFAMKLFLTLGV